MKKILFVHHGTTSVGAGLSALHIVNSIPKDKYITVVCLPQGKGDLEEKFMKMGVCVRSIFEQNCSYTHVNGYNYSFFSISHFRNIMELLKSQKILKTILHEEKPDIIMVNSMTLFWVGKFAKENGVKAVCFHRETYCRGLLGVRTAFIKKKLNANFDKIVFLSNYDMRLTGKEYDKYMRITDKVDCEIYGKLSQIKCKEELGLPQSKLILYTGGISTLKGIKVLLQTIPYIKTDVKIVILQYFDHYPQLRGIRKLRYQLRRMRGNDILHWTKKFIEEKNLADKLILRGRTDEVEKYFVACDLVVFPSQEAHQSRPIFEAGIAKRPIIVSDFDNTREFLDETNGWCVFYNDVKKWAEVCNTVLDGGKKIEAKTQENYRRAIMENSLEDLKNEIAELLSEIDHESMK